MAGRAAGAGESPEVSAVACGWATGGAELVERTKYRIYSIWMKFTITSNLLFEYHCTRTCYLYSYTYCTTVYCTSTASKILTGNTLYEYQVKISI